MNQLKVAVFLICVGILAATAGMAMAAPAVVEVEGPVGGELVSEQAGSEVLENNDAIGPEAGNPGSRVARAGCILPYSSVSYSIRLPANGRFLHKVVPDRRGFNVVMTLDYPGLFRRINQFGPGRTEAVTVRTGFFSVVGRVRISGVGGSYGCYRLGITP